MCAAMNSDRGREKDRERKGRATVLLHYIDNITAIASTTHFTAISVAYIALSVSNITSIPLLYNEMLRTYLHEAFTPCVYLIIILMYVCVCVCVCARVHVCAMCIRSVYVCVLTTITDNH